MLYLIWGLLNTAIFIYFLIICFKASKQIREKMGLFTAVFFVIVLLTYIVNTNSVSDLEKFESSYNTKWKNSTNDSLTVCISAFKRYKLEGDFMTSFHLDVVSGKEKDNSIIPLVAYISTNGFIDGLIRYLPSGTEWKTKSIDITYTKEPNKFSYFGTGIVKWKLLNLTIYSQEKKFEGTFVTKKPIR